MARITIPRTELGTTDLVIDAVYEGGRFGNAGDDPLGPLLGVSNQGGFRHLGKVESPNLVVVTTSMSEPDWPDSLDSQTGLFTYYGDNRQPGRELHSTPRWGNRMLRDMFERSHAHPSERHLVPPVLVFQTAGVYRDVRFIGLAVPGARGLSQTEDLVAVWRMVRSERFQNYRATFTVLNAPTISRAWIDEIRQGLLHVEHAPKSWKRWVESGTYDELRAAPIVSHRSKDEQLPSTAADSAILQAVTARFSGNPYEFERFAGRLCEVALGQVTVLDLTRPSRDGGRDGIGKFRIGSPGSSIEVEFALEAKCYSPTNSVNVKEMSRLISRLRYRQFGVLVTTSFVGVQAYKEIQEDGHPVLIMSGVDIVNALRKYGLRDSAAVQSWLDANFSQST